MGIRLAAVTLWAENVPHAAHFYRDLIGLPLISQHGGEHPHFDLDGMTLTILHGRQSGRTDPVGVVGNVFCR